MFHLILKSNNKQEPHSTLSSTSVTRDTSWCQKHSRMAFIEVLFGGRCVCALSPSFLRILVSVVSYTYYVSILCIYIVHLKDWSALTTAVPPEVLPKSPPSVKTEGASIPSSRSQQTGFRGEFKSGFFHKCFASFYVLHY